MASLHSTDSPDRASALVARDALAFVRIGGPEAVAFFRADDQEEAAAALVTFSAAPASEQDEADLSRRGLECSTALRDQGIPGVEASVRAATWLLRLFVACIVGAAAWVLVAFFAGDPDRAPLLLPPEVIFLPSEEILLLAPIVLIAVYAPAHLAVIWRERTTARAVLRWAADDHASRQLGIPAMSPFAGIMTSWERLRFCAGGVLMMDGFLTVFLFLVRRPDEPYGLFLAPVICALPILAVYLLSGARSRLAQRRHVLVVERLFRMPTDDADSAWTEDEENVEESVDGDTEWRTSF
ncbi:hypothetical protein [Brachybacterium vulturis]|uniref:hypothetical protein n=1 Tax=Brachybacterium vulturis TaxID=2017484 RepID=UPI0037370C8F